ncbi:YdcF family protein [Polyangium sp. y55x31]|uniref:YdcF family protein n=1 Tax=Polyangium sp. y55x31 TaxID=3042688 RepID=UPI002482B663|nr:YdcF family protein [Polyangium sp. y55x31]MDI1481252.1 YdcF family protein [Polyangium sp. y55x31]
MGLAVGLLALVNLAGEALRPPFDSTHTWLGDANLPRPIFRALELASAVVLLWHVARPLRPSWARLGGAIVVGIGAVLAAFDVATFYGVLARGAIRGPAFVPASLVVLVCLSALAASIATDHRAERPRWTLARAVACGAVTVASFVAMPLLLMITLGPTRYERRADCAIVFGARVWDDGTPSLALSDRVDEAIRLYQQGLVGALVMSGAVDDHNGFSEPEVMRSRAVAAGVPKDAVILDEAGITSSWTARNGALLMRRHGFSRAIAVTHYYHEPRVKMLFERAGVAVYTVPARMSRRLLKEPWFITREVLAYWHSFLLQ